MVLLQSQPLTHCSVSPTSVGNEQSVRAKKRRKTAHLVSFCVSVALNTNDIVFHFVFLRSIQLGPHGGFCFLLASYVSLQSLIALLTL